MKNTPDYLALINEDNAMAQDFLDNVRLITVLNGAKEEIQVEEKAYEAFLRLRQDILENDGIQIELLTSYRSIKRQEEVFALNLEKYGLEHTKKYVAIPGHSEHHTGLALDVSIMQGDVLPRARAALLEMDELYRTVHKKLPRYGFILRYPDGKTPITKIGYEPWHFRYINDPEIAQEITDRGICFEEYWEKA